MPKRKEHARKLNTSKSKECLQYKIVAKSQMDAFVSHFLCIALQMLTYVAGTRHKESNLKNIHASGWKKDSRMHQLVSQ